MPKPISLNEWLNVDSYESMRKDTKKNKPLDLPIKPNTHYFEVNNFHCPFYITQLHRSKNRKNVEQSDRCF